MKNPCSRITNPHLSMYPVNARGKWSAYVIFMNPQDPDIMIRISDIQIDVRDLLRTRPVEWFQIKHM